MDIMKQQHGQIFHDEKAHPKKPHAMNFRCNVTMATKQTQNNNKRQYQPNERRSAYKAI